MTPRLSRFERLLKNTTTELEDNRKLSATLSSLTAISLAAREATQAAFREGSAE